MPSLKLALGLVVLSISLQFLLFLNHAIAIRIGSHGEEPAVTVTHSSTVKPRPSRTASPRISTRKSSTGTLIRKSPFFSRVAKQYRDRRRDYIERLFLRFVTFKTYDDRSPTEEEKSLIKQQYGLDEEDFARAMGKRSNGNELNIVEGMALVISIMLIGLVVVASELVSAAVFCLYDVMVLVAGLIKNFFLRLRRPLKFASL